MRRILQFALKGGWWIACRGRALYYRLLPGIYFESFGKGTLVFGWPSFGTYFGNIAVGQRCMIGRDLFLSARQGARIEIGDNCSLNTGCHLVAIFGIQIDSGTRIGEFCSIRDQNHDFSNANESVSHQGYSGGPIRIGKNCWIGRGVFIGPNVSIGEGAVVGANAVVVKDVEPFSVVGGVPAKVIGHRNRETPQIANSL